MTRRITAEPGGQARADYHGRERIQRTILSIDKLIEKLDHITKNTEKAEIKI